MMTGATTDYLDPSAPVDYGVGRKCEWCETKVNRYTTRQNSDSKGPQGPLLCSVCAENWQDNELEKAIARETKKKQRTQTLPLPNLKAARKRAGISQVMLGRMAGLNDSFISDLERGKMGAGYASAHNLARSLGVSLDYLRGKS